MKRGKVPLLFDLISKRYHIQPTGKESDNSIEMQLIFQTHTLDKQQFSKFQEDVKQGKNPEESLKSMNYVLTFEKEKAEQLNNSGNRMKSTTENFAILTCLYTFGWINSEERPRNAEGFEILIDLLNRSTYPDMRKIVNFCFESLLTAAISPKTGIVWSQTSIQPVIVHFYTNNQLESSCFNLFIQFLYLVSSMGYENSTRDSQLLLEQIVRDNRPLIRTEHIGPLLQYLQPFISKPDMTCIRTICVLSNMYEDNEPAKQQIIDTFVLLSSSFVERISRTTPLCVFNDPDPENIPMKQKIGIFTEIFECTEMERGFMQPPFDKIDTDCQMSDFVPQTLYSFANDLSEILPTASLEARESFLRAMMHMACSSKDKTLVLVICSAFLITLKKIATPTLLRLLVPTLLTCFPFSHHYTIFNESRLHPWINLIRQTLIEKIYEVQKEQIVEIMESMYPHPILFTELIVRIMHHGNFPLSLFVTKKFLKLLTQSSIELITLTFPGKYEARISNFAFINELISDPNLSVICFSNTNFVPNYVSIAYETDLTETILLSVRNSLAMFDKEKYESKLDIEPIVDYLAIVIDTCSFNHTDRRYLFLLQMIAKTLVSVTEEQCWLSLPFKPLLMKFIDFILDEPDRDLLSCALSLLGSISRSMDYFILERQLFAKLVKAIKLVDKDEPSQSTKMRLMSLLSGYGAMTTTTKFYIKQPSVIPLIIASYGMSQYFKDIIQTFHQLCQTSTYNCRQLHDGDFDYIMISYISKKSEEAHFFYRNVELSIRMKKEDIRQFLIPLLETISLTKSSNAVAASLINFISKNTDENTFDMCRYLNELLCKCNTAPRPSFSLSISHEPQFEVSGIFGDDLNTGFSISLLMNVDVSPLMSSNASLSIISITDDDGYLLRLFASGNKIFIKYEAEYTRTSVHVVRQVPSKEWTQFTFVFSFGEKSVRISSYQNNESLNDSDLCSFRFNEGELNIVVGGVDSDPCSTDWNNAQIGTFGNLNIYNTKLTSKDVNTLLKKPWEFDKVPMFSSNVVCQPGTRSTISVPRTVPHEETGLFGGLIDKLTVDVCECKQPSFNLLDNMIDGGHGNMLALFFRSNCSIPHYQEMIFGLIKTIFKRSETAQKEFTEVSNILSSLYQHQNMLTIELYYSIYEVFEIITYSELRTEWFNKLLLNTWLWIHAPGHDFYAILTHWCTVLISDCYDIFSEKPYFSLLLTQFKMVFCFSKEDSDCSSLDDLVQEIDKTPNQFFDDTYTIQNVFKCRQMFTKLIKRVSFIKFVESDIPVLFSHLASCATKCSTIQMLQIIHDISENILKASQNLQKWITVLHIFVKSADIDIVEHSILCIHELAQSSIVVHSQAIALEISKIETKRTLFNRLLPKIEKYPNLFHLFCIFALDLGDDAISDLALKLHNVTTSPNTIITANWFVWPVILAFHSKDDILDCIIFFIAALLSLSKNRSTEFLQSLFFILLIQHLTPDNSSIRFDKQFILGVIKIISDNDMNFLPTAYYSIFSTTFYHLDYTLHTKPLLKALNESPFGPFPSDDSGKVIYLQEFSKLAQVELITQFTVETLTIGYQVNLDESGRWIDEDLSMAAVSLQKKFGCENCNEYINALLVMKNKSAFSDEQLKFYAEYSFEYNEEQRQLYESNFKRILGKVLNQVNDCFDASRRIKNFNSDDLMKNLKRESELTMHCDFESSLKHLINMMQTTTFLQPDKTSCFAFCPMKRKSRREKVALKISAPPDPLLQMRVNLMDYQHTRAVEFNLYRDKIVLCGNASTKIIPLNLVTHIFSRSKSDSRTSYDTMLEFFLTDGRSYFIDFNNFDVGNVFKFFQRNVFASLKFMQPLRQKNTFAQLPFTQQWVTGQISTFEYLMMINLFSGRTFNNPDMFPIMPALIAGYSHDGYVSDFTHKTDIAQDVTIDTFGGNANVNARVYFDPTVPGTLPAWADDRWDFIYKVRKLLESHSTTSILPNWIDNMFGKNMSKKQLHKQIFIKQHPPRQICQQPLLKNFSRNLESQSSKISFIAAFTHSCCSYSLLFILQTGTISQLDITFDQSVKIGQVTSAGTTQITMNSAFSFSNKGAVLFTPEQKKAQVIKNGKIVMSIPLFSETNLLSYAKNAFLFCPDFCTVSIVNELDPDPKPHTLCHSPCRITTLRSSSRFKIFTYGTIDGYVSVHNLRNGKLVNRVYVSGEPEHLIITRNWGFIVAATSTHFYILSVNGEQIRKTEIEEPIIKMFEFEYQGFDYIAYERSDRRLVFFEAFKPTEQKDFYESRESVSIINYNSYTESFFIVTSDSVKVVPHKII